MESRPSYSYMVGAVIHAIESIDYPMTRAELESMIAPFGQNFQSGSRGFVAQMISSQTDSQLREWILADMAAAPPAVAISAMKA